MNKINLNVEILAHWQMGMVESRKYRSGSVAELLEQGGLRYYKGTASSEWYPWEPDLPMEIIKRTQYP